MLTVAVAAILVLGILPGFALDFARDATLLLVGAIILARSFAGTASSPTLRSLASSTLAPLAPSAAWE